MEKLAHLPSLSSSSLRAGGERKKERKEDLKLAPAIIMKSSMAIYGFTPYIDNDSIHGGFSWFLPPKPFTLVIN